MSSVPDLRNMAMLYARALDAREGERMRCLFVEDGAVRGVRSAFIGREAVAAIPAVLEQRYSATLHFVGNVLLLEQEDRRASGETYCLAHHLRRNTDGAGEVYVMGIRYQDKLVLTEDGWRFQARDLIVDWEETRNCVIPATQFQHGGD